MWIKTNLTIPSVTGVYHCDFPLDMKRSLYGYVNNFIAGPTGRAVYGVGLPPLAC